MLRVYFFRLFFIVENPVCDGGKAVDIDHPGCHSGQLPAFRRNVSNQVQNCIQHYFSTDARKGGSHTCMKRCRTRFTSRSLQGICIRRKDILRVPSVNVRIACQNLWILPGIKARHMIIRRKKSHIHTHARTHITRSACVLKTETRL